MNEAEIEAIKRAFGLSHINDPEEIRAEIDKRFNNMNAFDRAAVQMEIGRRMTELEAQRPGDKYSPATWSLAVTALVFCVLAAVAVWAVFSTSLWLVVKIVLGIFAAFWFVAAWRSIARVLFRLANGRDM